MADAGYTDKMSQISDCGRYRYMLGRVWDSSKKLAVFLMLNPSTADADQDDPTIKKCVAIANHNGFGSIAVVNLFAFRATDCTELRSAADPVGPENDDFIRRVCHCTEDRPVVCAWGRRSKFATPRLMDRPYVVRRILEEVGAKTYRLRVTNEGDPYHPLMLPHATAFEPWPMF